MHTLYGAPIIFSGRGNRPLAKAICEELHCPLAESEVYDFPNGDIFVHLRQSVRGHDVSRHLDKYFPVHELPPC